MHAERKVSRLISLTPQQQRAMEKVRDPIWKLNRQLKDCRAAPSDTQRQRLTAEFERLVAQRTCDRALNEALELLAANREGLLAAPEHPHLPLRKNRSENDIREYARPCKVSSDLGCRGRDTPTPTSARSAASR